MLSSGANAEAQVTLRQHSSRLDLIRIACLVLGVFYHSAQSFVPQTGPWYLLEDRHTHWAFQSFTAVVHAIRMPLFLALAGFLANPSLERKGSRAFLFDRLRRLGLPLVVALPIQWLSEWMVLEAARARGLLSPTSTWAGPFQWAPRHLWFLEYLVLFAVVLIGLKRVPDGVKWVAVACSLGGSVLLGEGNPGISLIPVPHSLLSGFGFFLLGTLLPSVMRPRRFRWLTLPALVIAVLIARNPTGILASPIGSLVLAIMVCLRALNWAREASTARPWLNEAANAAYWVYLVHFPLVLTGQLLVAREHWPAIVKWMAVAVVSVLFASGSFFLGVRRAAWASAVGLTRLPSGSV